MPEQPENEAQKLTKIETAYRQYGWPGAEREIRAALSDTEANLVSMQRENEEIHRSYELKLREYEGRIEAEEIERLEGLVEAWRKKANEYRIEADCALRDCDAMDLERGLAAERAEATEARLREVVEVFSNYDMALRDGRHEDAETFFDHFCALTRSNEEGT